MMSSALMRKTKTGMWMLVMIRWYKFKNWLLCSFSKHDWIPVVKCVTLEGGGRYCSRCGKIDEDGNK